MFEPATHSLPFPSWLPITIIMICFFAVAIAELAKPDRVNADDDGNRILVNFAWGISLFAMVAILPVSTTAFAHLAKVNQWGLFNAIDLPLAVVVIGYAFARSLLDYAMHRLYHRSALLWSLHKIHHSDHAIDASTALRSHPLSVVINLLASGILISALGAPTIVVLIIDSIVFNYSFFHHANVRLSDKLSTRLERWLVTPRMHLVHHARDRALHDSNYGEILSIWDHVFGTYRALPAEPFVLGANKEEEKRIAF